MEQSYAVCLQAMKRLAFIISLAFTSACVGTFADAEPVGGVLDVVNEYDRSGVLIREYSINEHRGSSCDYPRLTRTRPDWRSARWCRSVNPYEDSLAMSHSGYKFYAENGPDWLVGDSLVAPDSIAYLHNGDLQNSTSWLIMFVYENGRLYEFNSARR